MPATPIFWQLTLTVLWSERWLQLHVRLYFSHGHVSNYNMKRENETGSQHLCKGSFAHVVHSLQCDMGIKIMEMKYLNPVLYFSASHRKHCKNLKSRIGHCSDSSPKVLYQDITSSAIILNGIFYCYRKQDEEKKKIFSKCFTSAQLSQLSHFSKHS